MQSSILVCLSEPFVIWLDFCFHDTTNCDNVSTDTWVYQIILNFTFYCLRHFTCIYIINVIFYFLNFQSLVKRSPSCMFLWIEYSAFTVNIYASIRSFPFPINETNDNFRFTLMASELDWFNENFNRTYSQNCSSNANIFINQVRLYHAHWKYMIEDIKPQDNRSLINETINILSHIVQSKRYWFNNIIRMLINIFQKLFYIRVSAWIKIGIVDINYNIFEIIFFFFPF